MMCSKRIAILSLSVLLLAVTESPAQEGRYWSEKYGNRSVLLSGTVNASVEDLGTVFYNPGRLGLIENPAFAISAKAYEWRNLRIEDEDEGIDLNQSKFGGAPSLVAGTFKVPFLKNHKFAYSFLTRQRNNLDFFTRIEREGDLIEGLPGNQDIFNAKLDVDTEFKEEWIGLTWAPPVSEQFGVGLSTFVSALDKSNFIGVDMNALNEFNQSAYYSVNRRYSYESYGLIWKLGMALNLEKVQLGMTVTSPRLNVFGNGSVLVEDYLVGLDTSGDGVPDDSFVFDNQDDLEATYRTPLAIGLGVGIPFKKGVIHISAEWYDKVSEYTILEIEPFVGQSTGETIGFLLQDRLESVINYGMGVEYQFSEKLSSYGSFATNYSAVPSGVTRLTDFEEITNNSIVQADFIQFAGGFSLSTKAVDITLGGSYEGGSSSFTNAIDFPDEEDQLPEANAETRLSVRNWRFILGFSFPFADKMLKELKE